jgi:hypothetical protein
LWFDQRYFLPDDILNKADRMSMAHSLEVRPPFLDHRIVEFAASLPASLKIRGSRQKVLLKELMRDKLPASVLRRKKIGFDIPAHDWLRGCLRPLMMEVLLDGSSEHGKLFRRDVIETYIRQHMERRVNVGYHLWGLMVLFLWMKKWGIQAAAPRRRTFGYRKKLVPISRRSAGRGRHLSGCIVSPPSLMDDVDAVQAQIARNMLTSGDWVTARLDGVVYLEKAPLIYWAMAASYKIFGAHDWAARIPIALSAIALCWLTSGVRRMGFRQASGILCGSVHGHVHWAVLVHPDFDPRRHADLHGRPCHVGVSSRLGRRGASSAVLGFCAGREPRARAPAEELDRNAVSAGGGRIYLGITHQLFSAATWRKLHPFSGLLIILLIAAPWHILATLRNPPYFAFTLHSGPGQYHGFLWFFFINEQLLRFLNLRYPRDYNTVPALYFWLLHLVWLFPWSVYFPAIAKLSFKPDRSRGRTRLLALCWTGFVLVFFTFSTTQEYYSMPCYPALALLLGAAMAMGGNWIRRGTRALSVIAACAWAGYVGSVFSHPQPSRTGRHFAGAQPPSRRL